MKTDKIEKIICTLLCDAHRMEEQMADKLPDIAKEVTHPKIKALVENHVAETKAQMSRTENAFDHLGEDRKDVDSPILEQLMNEGETLYTGCEEGPVRDAAILVALQRIQHQKIATYGSIVALAKAANQPEIVSLFERSLDEEYAADKAMTQMAEGFANVEAVIRTLPNIPNTRRLSLLPQTPMSLCALQAPRRFYIGGVFVANHHTGCVRAQGLVACVRITDYSASNSI